MSLPKTYPEVSLLMEGLFDMDFVRQIGSPKDYPSGGYICEDKVEVILECIN